MHSVNKPPSISPQARFADKMPAQRAIRIERKLECVAESPVLYQLLSNINTRVRHPISRDRAGHDRDDDHSRSGRSP